MNRQEWEWTLELMEQDERQRQQREDAKYRARFWRTYALLVTVFCIAVAGAFLTGCSVWPETVMGGVR